MRQRITSEHGSALVTALLLTMIMLTVGLAGLAQVDVQQEQSGTERVRETSFNLGEGVLNAQIFALSQRWPGPGALTAPASALLGFGVCTEASNPLTSPNCPDPATIKGLFVSPDTAGPTAWRTEVRDNDSNLAAGCAPAGASTFYSDECTAGLPGHDRNGDGRLWARAQATVRGRTRTMVALAQAERETQQLPRAALLAGRLEIGNNGNKRIVDAQADTALNAEILLRCKADGSLLGLLAPSTPCVGQAGLLNDLWSTTGSLLRTQLGGTKPKTGYQAEPALSAQALANLKQTAISNGTYFETCPPNEGQLAGAVVYIETCNRAYKSNTTINSAEAPGALIIANGFFELLGNTTYHGLVYHANKAGSTENLVKLNGNNGVNGAVFVEGALGGVFIQGSAFLTINGAAFDALQTYGSAGIIQNTWREIPRGG